MAERIKLHVGSALTDLGDEAPEDYIVHGPNRITALPMEVPVCYQEIAHCLDKPPPEIGTWSLHLNFVVVIVPNTYQCPCRFSSSLSSSLRLS